MGATSGIGLQVAIRLALMGWKVGAAGRNSEALRRLKARFPESVETETIDITADDAPGRLGDLIAKLGEMDTYFHVSGVGYENPRLDPAVTLRTIETNVTGFARMIDAAYAYFRDFNPHGHIAAVTSVAGTRGIGPMAAYSSSKKFGQTYLEALRQLACSQGLHLKITDIRPGWIHTPLIDKDKIYPMAMTLDYATPRIVSSLLRKSAVSYIDWRWRIACALMRLVPACLWQRLPLRLYKER